ncbi:MAG: ATP-binding protein [Clostridia bacterium]
MMKDISLHILDIVENSISANAKNVEICIEIETDADNLTVSVRDDGKGMDEDTAAHVISPFSTSRTTRKVGLGIPFFKAGAEMTDGSFSLESALGKGTFIAATYTLSHIDRPPLGDIADTMKILIVCNQDVDFLFVYKLDEAEFKFDTKEVRRVLGDIPFSVPDVMAFIGDSLNEGITEINGGMII